MNNDAVTLRLLPKPLQFDYDFLNDVITIEGIRYHVDLFRGLGLDITPHDVLFRIVKREDGVVSIQQVKDRELVERFESLFGAWPFKT